MKKYIFAVVIVLVLAGATAGYFKRHKQPVKTGTAPAVTSPLPEPVVVPTAPPAEPVAEVSSGYVIVVLSVSKSTGTEALNVRVTNDGDTPLDLMPDKQFKLVGLTSKIVRAPHAKTNGFEGTLAANGKMEGSIYFDTLNGEDTEVRFYPDPMAATYIVVPLIPLPTDQR